MLILGIDTSCDDTAAAVVEDGRRIVSNVVSSQNVIHQKYGGIVPELASRRHIEMIWPVVHEALQEAAIQLMDITAIAVTHGPGLIGSLLVGVCFAKSLSHVNKIPMIAVNHLEGHIFSAFLEFSPKFPFLALVVSGGHTSLYLVNELDNYIEMARTRDDAAGEAFDKVAKLLELGYPGGPIINSIASAGKPDAISFPRARIKNSLDFSFSGVKTAVLHHVKNHPDSRKEDIAASFQEAVVDVLEDRMMEAAGNKEVKRIALSGGVAANSLLRERIKFSAAERGYTLYLPSLNLCTDNAAMIAAAGFYHYKNNKFANYSLNPRAYLPLGSMI